MLRIPPAPIGALALLIASLAVPWGAAPAVAQESPDGNGSAAAPQKQERSFVLLGRRSWSSDVGSVAGGPDLSPTGPFIRFQVGAGARP